MVRICKKISVLTVLTFLFVGCFNQDGESGTPTTDIVPTLESKEEKSDSTVKDEEVNNSTTTSNMEKAEDAIEPLTLTTNLTGAETIALVNSDFDPVSARVVGRGNMKMKRRKNADSEDTGTEEDVEEDGKETEEKYCSDMTLEELKAKDEETGAFVNSCKTDKDLPFCEGMDRDKLDTGRIACKPKHLRAGDLVAFDKKNQLMKLIPQLPSWNRVARIQSSSNILLVTLEKPVKLLQVDGKTNFCLVLYYNLDSKSGIVTPYCYHYDYQSAACSSHHAFSWNLIYKPEKEEKEYTAEVIDKSTGEYCFYSHGYDSEYFMPSHYVSWENPGAHNIHVTDYALFESYYKAGNGTVANESYTRIVHNNNEGIYPIRTDYFTKGGIISGSTYYSFNAKDEVINGELGKNPLVSYYTRNNMVFEADGKIIYGLSNGFDCSDNAYVNVSAYPVGGYITLKYFDTEKLKDGKLEFRANGCNWCYWTFVAAAGNFVFLKFGKDIYRVDLKDDDPEAVLALGDVATDNTYYSEAVLKKNFSVHVNRTTMKNILIFKIDGTVVEVDFTGMGIALQNVDVEDTRIVASGMEGLTPKKFNIDPMADGDDFMVEVGAEPVLYKTLIPLR